MISVCAERKLSTFRCRIETHSRSDVLYITLLYPALLTNVEPLIAKIMAGTFGLQAPRHHTDYLPHVFATFIAQGTSVLGDIPTRMAPNQLRLSIEAEDIRSSEPGGSSRIRLPDTILVSSLPSFIPALCLYTPRASPSFRDGNTCYLKLCEYRNDKLSFTWDVLTPQVSSPSTIIELDKQVDA